MEKNDLMTEVLTAGIFLRLLYPPRRFVCDERSHYLHSDESTVGAGDRHLRLLVHPGLGGLPPGAHQRTHLCHLKEARMSSIPVTLTATPTPHPQKVKRRRTSSLGVIMQHQNNVSFQRCI